LGIAQEQDPRQDGDSPFVVEAYTAGSLASSFKVAACSLSRSFGLGVRSSTLVFGLPRLRGGMRDADADVAAVDGRNKRNRLEHLGEIRPFGRKTKIKQLRRDFCWFLFILLDYKQGKMYK